MEWDTIIERHYEASRSAVALLPTTTKVSNNGSSREISTGIIPPLAAVSLPVGLYCLYVLRGNEGDNLVNYEGSCHCQAVRFEMVAPKELAVETYTETSPYDDVMHRYTKVRASNFEITLGKEELKTYYVEPTQTKKRSLYRKEEPQMGARSFCKRCGVHILYAPSKSSAVMHINITCVTVPAIEEGQSSAVEKHYSQDHENIGKMIIRTGLVLARVGQEMLKKGSNNKLANSLMEAARKLLMFLKPVSGTETPPPIEHNVSSDDLSSSALPSPSSIQEKRKKKRELEAKRSAETPNTINDPVSPPKTPKYYVRQQ